MSSISVAEEDEALLTINRNRQESQANHTNLYIATFFSLLAPILMGYTLGYSSPALPDLVDENILITDSQQSWFGSMIAIGAISGGPIAGICVAYFGRKYSVMLCALPLGVGYAIIASVSNVAALYVGRILTGIGTGMVSLSTPVYIAELSSPDRRGALGASFQLSITIGILLVNIFGISLSYVWLANVGCALCAFLVVFMLFMPETPHHCIIRHERERALSILSWLRGVNFNVVQELRDIEDNINSQSEDFHYREYLQPNLYIPLAISLFLMLFQQFSGINAVIFYAVSIFHSAVPSIEEHEAAIIVTGVQVVATFVSVLLMDRAGRRILLIIAGVGMCISSTSFGVYYQLSEKNNTNNASTGDFMVTASSSSNLAWLAMTSMVVYITSFSLGWGAIPWLIMSEIFPTRARSSASAIATAVNWIFAFIVTKEFYAMSSAMTDAGAFWFFGGICFLGVVFVAVCVPETKGKSLEEISDYFSRDQRVLDFPVAVGGDNESK